MLEITKEEHVYRRTDTFIQEPWREINRISKDNLKGRYEILLYNMTDCNKIPEPFKFVVMDWENLKVLVYREPELKIFSFEDYNTLLRTIKHNEQKFISEGMHIQDETSYKRVFLFKDLNKPGLKSLTKGEKTIKPGDFLSTCWGYDQTNVELYVIKKILGKNYFIIQEIGQALGEETHTPVYDNIKVDERIIKIDLPEKAFISNDGYMHVCEYGYQRGLHLTTLEQEHYKTNGQFGH